MKRYLVEVQTGSDRWMSLCTVNARSAAGAINQIAKNMKNLSDVTAIRASET